MGTRQVRSDSGALFEVDASMLDAAATEPGYRGSSAPPHARAIVRRVQRGVDWDGIVLRAAVVVGVGVFAIAIVDVLAHLSAR